MRSAAFPGQLLKAWDHAIQVRWRLATPKASPGLEGIRNVHRLAKYSRVLQLFWTQATARRVLTHDIRLVAFGEIVEDSRLLRVSHRLYESPEVLLVHLLATAAAPPWQQPSQLLLISLTGH
jgi:hypothetical protein